MQRQDATDPTGVAVVNASTDHVTISRARQRKANAAIQMRLGGARYDEIAEVLGFPTARQALVAVERTLEKELKASGDRDAMRRMAGARLERLLRGVWAKAIDPNHPDHLVAVQKARELVDRHAKLFGLDSPTEIVVHSPTASELEAWVSRVVAVGMPQVQEYDIIDGEIEEGPDESLPA